MRNEQKEQFAESQKPIDGDKAVESADWLGYCTYERVLVNVDKGIRETSSSSAEILASPMMQVHFACSMCH
jgi:hypothetical protein